MPELYHVLPSCALLATVKTQWGKRAPLLLFASANLRKYNHSLLVQLPAELQTQAVSWRIFQTLQRLSVSVRSAVTQLNVFKYTAL